MKRTAVVILAILLLVGMTGCAGSGSGNAGSSETEQSGTIQTDQMTEEVAQTESGQINDENDNRQEFAMDKDSVITNAGTVIPFASLKHYSGNGSTVYYTKDITPEALVNIYEALRWTAVGNVGVKISTGEPPASHYLDPALMKDLVQMVNGTIVECNTAYGGSRASTAMHYQVAADHGYTAIANVDILDEDGSMTLAVDGGQRLTENYVGSHFADYDSYIILSHFKGHAMAGFGGAIKNISIGFGSGESGKSHIHTGGAGGSMWSADQDSFLEAMADAGKSVSDYMGNGERIVYINVMNNLSVDCDCDGNASDPDMHDIGILASADPVALDQACVDLVLQAPDHESLQNRMESRNGYHTLEAAEKVGLGRRTYRLVSIDVERKEESMDSKITVSFNGHTYDAVLEGNTSAMEFVQYIRDEGGSVTINASDYGNFEKVGALGTNITRNDTQITTVPGDIILYQGNQITVYYAENSWNFTRLGKLAGDLSNLKSDLGNGNVEITFSIAG